MQSVLPSEYVFLFDITKTDIHYHFQPGRELPLCTFEKEIFGSMHETVITIQDDDEARRG